MHVSLPFPRRVLELPLDSLLPRLVELAEVRGGVVGGGGGGGVNQLTC